MTMSLRLFSMSMLAVSLALPNLAAAKPWWMRGVESNEGDFLPPDQAFQVTSTVDAEVLRIRYVIADGYYLYRQKMEVAAESPDLVVAAPDFPAGTMKTDPYLGTQEIFTQQVEATVAYQRLDAGAHPIQIKVTYQGCAEAGLCYPPITKVMFPGPSQPAAAAAATPTASARARAVPPDRPWQAYGIIGGALAFFLAGLLLRKGRRIDSPA
jgi:thioredoxin:protein disulfide reductase